MRRSLYKISVVVSHLTKLEFRRHASQKLLYKFSRKLIQKLLRFSMWKDEQEDMKKLTVAFSSELTTLLQENTTYIRNLILKVVKR